jgi:hypothetical protein
MLNLVTLSKQSAVAQQRSATCAGYWLENSIGGFTSDNTSIEHNPMHTASFYKGSGN